MSIYEILEGAKEFVKTFPLATGAAVLTIGVVTTKYVYDIKHMKKVEKEIKEVSDTYKKDNDGDKWAQGMITIAKKYPEVKEILREYLKNNPYDKNNKIISGSSNNTSEGIEKKLE